MEDKAILTIRSMLGLRGIKTDTVESLGSAIDETRMFNIGGYLIIFSEKGRITENILQSYMTFADEHN